MNAIVVVFVGAFVTTSYRSVPSQCDSSPYYTSIGQKVSDKGIAVHPSLLCSRAKIFIGKKRFVLCKRGPLCPNKDALHYGDQVYIQDVGFRVVNDCMAAKTKMNSRVDVWVASLNAEKVFHAKHCATKSKIWRVIGYSN